MKENKTNRKIYKFSKYNIFISNKEESLIYNSFSGALSIFNNDEMVLMNQWCEDFPKQLARENQVFLDKVLINNFLVPNDVDETAILEQKYQKQKNDTESMSLTILPTLGCNFDCNYCFEGKNKSSEVMSTEVQDHWIIWFEKHMKGIKRLNVTWFGGEPTIAMQVIRRMSDRLIALCDMNKISYSASIITNGYTMTDELAGELYTRRVKMIQITFDGPLHIHDQVRFTKNRHEGSFEKIIKNINSYSLKFPIRTSLRINVDERNENQCFELLDQLELYLKNAKNTSVYFAPIHASTELCEHISEYTLEALHFAELETKLMNKAIEKGLAYIGLPPFGMGLCGATKMHGYVAVPNGDIHKCWETVSMPKYKVGNINNMPQIDEQNYKRWLKWSPFCEDICKNCRILPNCLGMCTYRFLYKENYTGNSAVSPCPSIKYELESRLLMYLEKHCNYKMEYLGGYRNERV